LTPHPPTLPPSLAPQEEECDICVLEEPEHLNWYRAPGENWTSKFKHVVGIVHTNYFVYATEQPAAFIRVS
jgi:digalactosyldiacylglycerol synthase